MSAANVIFIFFFSQKEHPTRQLENLWPVLSPLYLGIWGVVFFVMCYKNIPNHAGTGRPANSKFFSNRMLSLADPEDRREGFRVEIDLNKKASENTLSEHKKQTDKREVRRSDTDIIMGGTTIEEVKVKDVVGVGDGDGEGEAERPGKEPPCRDQSSQGEKVRERGEKSDAQRRHRHLLCRPNRRFLLLAVALSSCRRNPLSFSIGC